MRLDKFLQTEFGLRSRTYAENLILRGRVAVNGRQILKPAADVAESDKVEILSDEDYASQGAYKIEEAHRVFGFAVSGLDCADIGCSNGGFTDFLLRHGAKSVLAVDVGECALPEKLSGDPRVTFLRANARELPQGRRSRGAGQTAVRSGKTRVEQKGNSAFGKGQTFGARKREIRRTGMRLRSLGRHSDKSFVVRQKHGISAVSAQVKRRAAAFYAVYIYTSSLHKSPSLCIKFS